MTTTTNNLPVASQELLERCTQIRQLMAGSCTNFHAIGVQYNYIVDNKLAEKAGYKNAPEFLTQQIKELSRSSLTMYGNLARTFTAEICGTFGVSILNQLMIYAEVAGMEVDTNDPGAMIVQVPDIHGELEDRLFGECSVADLRKAIQRLRRPTSSAPLPPEVNARVQQCSTVLADFFAQQLGVRVQVRNRKGKAVLNLQEVPLEQMEEITALLSTVLRSRAA